MYRQCSVDYYWSIFELVTLVTNEKGQKYPPLYVYEILLIALVFVLTGLYTMPYALMSYAGTVHDTENLTFSADDRAENPHISARTISGFRADNQRIPRGHLEDSAWTISGFRAELCGCNSQSNLLPA